MILGDRSDSCYKQVEVVVKPCAIAEASAKQLRVHDCRASRFALRGRMLTTSSTG